MLNKAMDSDLYRRDSTDERRPLLTPSETESEDSEEKEEKREMIYFNLCYTNFQKTRPLLASKLDHVKNELITTEINYVENTLNMLKSKFIRPLTEVLSEGDANTIFYGITELSEVHTGFHSDLSRALTPIPCPNGSSSDIPRPLRCAGDVFLRWKEKFIIYGNYCSNLPKAQDLIFKLCATNEEVNKGIKYCIENANLGVFELGDVLMVPMQRITKYPLLLKELLKELSKSSQCEPEDYERIEQAKDAMAEVLEFSNRVVEDNKTLMSIKQIEDSIDNLNLPDKKTLSDYGRPHQTKGELRIGGLDDTDNKKIKVRWVFLFDQLLLICRSTGTIDHLFGREQYTHTNSFFLNEYRLEDIPHESSSTTFCWKLVYILSSTDVYTMCASTEQEKIEWMAAIREALNTIQPGDSKHHSHNWAMHTFPIGTSCSRCRKLLQGMFFQGYRCSRCETGVHRDCITNISRCKAFGSISSGTICSSTGNSSENGLPMLLSPMVNFLSNLKRSKSLSDTRRHSISPFSRVHQTFCEMDLTPAQSPTDLNECMWFAGEMSRETAETALISKSSGTFLVRMRVSSSGATIVRSYALSFKLNRTVSHAKIYSSPNENQFSLVESRQFQSLSEMIDWYRRNSLCECFPGMNARLQRPFRRSISSQDETPELL